MNKQIMNKQIKTLCITAILLFGISCTKHNTDWIILFDGKKVNGLRGYKMDSFPWDSWEIKNGSLKTIPGKHGMDIISDDIFKDFELELEWKLQSGGNSGIFYYASEKGDYIWQSAPEMQVLDDLSHQDRLKKTTSAGALYGLIAPEGKKLKPLGEFNQVKIISKNNQVEHWLNGVRILKYEYGGEHVKSLISKSKFSDMPYFSTAMSGRIGLQGDHGEVWYRNIRIKRL